MIDRHVLVNKTRHIYLEAGERGKNHDICLSDVKFLIKNIDELLKENNTLLEQYSTAIGHIKQHSKKLDNILRYLLGKCQRSNCKTVNSEATTICGVCKRVLLFLKDNKKPKNA